MKKLSRLAALGLSGVLALGLAACGGTGTSETPSGGESPASGGESSAAGTVYSVGICQLAPHDALDAATQGFKDALVEAFGEDGVTFDEQNAGGEYNNCATIVDGFVAQNVDLILANATYSPSWAPPSPTTVWPWIWTPPRTVCWGATSPAPPTWPPWTSRRP